MTSFPDEPEGSVSGEALGEDPDSPSVPTPPLDSGQDDERVELGFGVDAESDSGDEPADGEVAEIPLAEVVASIEAMLYAASEPLSLKHLTKHLPEAGDQIDAAFTQLLEDYSADGRGLSIVEVAGGYQIVTRPEHHERISRLFHVKKPTRLSIQALETLSVVAYRQPVTVPEIMELRGVNSAGVIRTLLEKRLIRIVGRKNVVGRPLLYGTTKDFMLRFGLKTVKDLPQLQDMTELFGEESAEQFLGLEDVLPAVEDQQILPVDDNLTPVDVELEETGEQASPEVSVGEDESVDGEEDDEDEDEDEDEKENENDDDDGDDDDDDDDDG